MRISLVLLCLVLACLAVGILPVLSQPTGEIELLRADSPPQTSLRFEQFTIADGLSSQTAVYAITQDRKGFIWIGTGVGLNRYDGYSFTHYKSNPFDSTSIASDLVYTALYEDRSGAIWVGNTTGELNRLDPITEDFTHWKHIPGDPTSLSSGSVTAIYERRSGDLWVGTYGSLLRDTGGLNLMNRSNGTFTRYLHDPDDPTSLSSNNIRDLFEDDTGALWISTANGLNRLDSESGRFSRYLYGAANPEGLADDPGYRFTRFYPDVREESVVWVGSKNGFVRFNTRSGEHTRFIFDATDISTNFVAGIVRDPEDEAVLWMATRKAGLYRYDTRTGRSTNYRHEPGNANSIGSNGLYCIYADRTGIIWLCGEDDGVMRFDPAVAGLTHYSVLPRKANSLSVGTVHGIAEDRTGALWVGVGNATEGLNRIDRPTGKVSRWTIPIVTSIEEDRSGIIWVGSKSVGLSRWNADEREFTSYRNIPGDSTSLSADFVWTIYEDRDGVLWVGTREGLNRMERQSGEFIRFMHDPDDPTTISSEAAVSLHQDHAGMLWVGTMRGGLNRMDRATGTFTRYSYDPTLPGTLSSNAVWSIWEREREPGILWIGTGGGGLNRLDTRNGTFTHFTQKDGLPDNSVWGILEDERGRLWISTTGGLSRFDPEDETFRNFGLSSGLPPIEFKDLAYAKSRSGELFFGGVNGLLAFYPDQMHENPHPPQVSLTGLRLFSRPVVPAENSILKQPISSTDEIQLEHDQNSITFEYVALHFRNPARNQYAIKLEGVDHDWVKAGTQRSVTYTNLGPGHYTFRLKASNSDGIWNEEGTSIRVMILPPWWRTWWASILYGLLFLAGVVAVDRAQRRRVIRRERQKAQITESQLKAKALQAENRRQEVELEKARELEAMNVRLQEQAKLLVEMDRVKGRFFSNISHEFRTPMTLLLAPLRDALDSGNELRLGRQQLALMHRNGERLLRLINELLDLSRIEDGSMHLSVREADVVTLLKDVVLAFSSRAEREQITLSFHSEESQLLLYYDPEKLEKVLFNLLSNAIKFTAPGGKVRVSAALVEHEAAMHALIVVKDTGQGIPSDKLTLIFDRFYQVDDSATRRHEGTGIGLALSKELIELHGGTISVASEVGFGSTFMVRLRLGKQHLRPEDLAPASSPARDAKLRDVEPYMIGEAADALPNAEDPEDAPVAEAEENAGEWEATTEATSSFYGMPQSPDAPTVLIVEDNGELREYLRRHLAERYHVAEADNGVDALAQAHMHPPDLIISDVMMPRMDGYALCSAIKADEKLNHVPVILLTAKAAEESKLGGLETGADDYLSKPFSTRELLIRVENLIEVRRVLRRRFSAEVVLGPSHVIVASEDATFIERVRQVVEAHLGDTEFGVGLLADEVGLSTRQLHRKLRQVVDLSPAGYIRFMRLERAAQLLRQQAKRVSEVAYDVGFRDVDHFSRLFKQAFGKTPSEFADTEL